MAYDSREPEESEPWQRSTHILNLLTYGQIMCDEGERIQNPKIIGDGVSMMLENLGPLMKEAIKDPKTGKTKTLLGHETEKYKKYYMALSEARGLINIAMNNVKLSNKGAVLNRAYQILNAIKIDLLQEANDTGINFKKKPDPLEAWKE